MKYLIKPVVLSIGILFAGAANAADTMTSTLGGQVVYDATTNLSWIANANLATSNTFGVSGIGTNGSMNWSTAQNWIAAMDASNYLGYSDWRLPTSDTCGGNNCTSSEMGNLFYNGLGGVAGNSILTTHNANLALFNNVLSSDYWSGTEFAPSPNLAWNFVTIIGNQNIAGKNDNLFALAVRTGNVAAVPEPGEYALMAVGLGLMGFMVHRKKSA